MISRPGLIRLREPSLFLVVGTASALVDGGLFLLLVHLGTSPAPASAMGFSAAFVVNYLGNRDLVFRRASHGSLRRYFILVGVNLALSTAGVAVLVYVGLTPLASKLTTMVVVAAVNFVVLRSWVFPRRREPSPTPLQPHAHRVRD